MKKTLLTLLILFFVSCGVKQTQSLLNNGDYDAAIYRSLEGLSTNKNSKGNQDYVYLLEEAFAKAKAKDLNDLNLLLKENNASNLERIYNYYTQLHARQERIKAVLPLKLIKEDRNAIFPFDDYSDELIASKNDLSNYLYNNAKKLLNSKNKLDFRQAYDDLNYLDKLNPNFKDVRNLMDKALFKGTDYVYVSTKNDTRLIIPERLQSDLLNFGTFGLNDKWIVYHNRKQNDVFYDFNLQIDFRDINISPEQVKEKQFVKEKQIKDGSKNLLDANGNPVKDQNGNNVVVDNMKTVTVSIYEFTQFKSCQINAMVNYYDNRSNQLMNSFPLTSEYVFDYKYATFNGDKRACENDYLPFFDKRAVPFPSTEQMVYDSGEDLKTKLKSIITKNRFRG